MTAAGWRKASASMADGNCVEVADWRKSSDSHANGNCVEVAGGPVVLVRDSADRAGPVLRFTPAGWGAFLGAVRGGRGAGPWR